MGIHNEWKEGIIYLSSLLGYWVKIIPGTLAMVDLYLGWVQEKISGTKDRMEHYQGRVEGIIPVTRLDAKTRINPITFLTRRDNPSYLG